MGRSPRQRQCRLRRTSNKKRPGIPPWRDTRPSGQALSRPQGREAHLPGAAAAAAAAVTAAAVTTAAAATRAAEATTTTAATRAAEAAAAATATATGTVFTGTRHVHL
jgi:hypothetical protein